MSAFKLFLMQLKVSFGLSALRWYSKHDRKKFFGALGMLALIIASLSPLVFFNYKLTESVFVVGLKLGQPEIVLATGMMTASMMVLFFGMMLVFSMFFYAADLPLLVPLPLKPGTILGAKFAVIVAYEYLTIAPFLLPALWVFGRGAAPGFFYWLAAPLVFLLTPLIPISLATLFILSLMSLTNLSKKKEAIRVIAMVLFLLLILGLNYFLTGLPEGEEMAYVEALMTENEGLLRQMTALYPPAHFAVRALCLKGLQSLSAFVYFLLINAAGLALVYFAGQKLFYRGLVGSSEVSPGQALSEEVLAKRLQKKRPAALAIAGREIKYLLRTPVYFFNSLLLLILVPVIILIPLAKGGLHGELVTYLRGELPAILKIGALAGFIAMMALFTPASSSTFSREGAMFWLSKVIPVSAKVQVQGKILYSLLISFLSIPVIILINLLFLSLEPLMLFLAVILGVAASLPAILISLFIDLLRPYLSWDNPQKAIKQNLNVVFSMLAAGLVEVLIFGAGGLFYWLTEDNLAALLATFLTALGLGALFYILLLHLAPRRYSNLEI